LTLVVIIQILLYFDVIKRYVQLGDWWSRNNWRFFSSKDFSIDTFLFVIEQFPKKPLIVGIGVISLLRISKSWKPNFLYAR
jgi:hypothetical protein